MSMNMMYQPMPQPAADVQQSLEAYSWLPSAEPPNSDPPSIYSSSPSPSNDASMPSQPMHAPQPMHPPQPMHALQDMHAPAPAPAFDVWKDVAPDSGATGFAMDFQQHTQGYAPMFDQTYAVGGTMGASHELSTTLGFALNDMVHDTF